MEEKKTEKKAKQSDSSLEEGLLEVEGLPTPPTIDNQETSVDVEQSDYEIFNIPNTESLAPNLSSNLTQLNWETLDSAPEIGFTAKNGDSFPIKNDSKETQTDEFDLSESKKCESFKDELVKEAEMVRDVLQEEIQELIEYINTQKSFLEKKFEQKFSEHDMKKVKLIFENNYIDK